MASSRDSFSSLALWLVLSALVGCSPAVSDSAAVGEDDSFVPLAGFHDGSSRPWSSFDGDYLLVNYWAEWCKPCRKEIPELNELDAEEGVSVVGVNFDGIQGEELIDLMQRLGIEFPVSVEDPREVWGVAPIEVLPTTIVVDTTGQAKHVLIGPQTAQTLHRAMSSS